MAEIKVRDIGPVVDFELDMNEPGLWIIKGENGVGKTTVIRTVALAVDGTSDVRLTRRDGATRGEADIAGKKIRVMKTIREEGELSLEGLEGLSIVDLHTPKYDKPTTRDKHRIRALVKLTGLTADATLFHRLVESPERFAEIVSRASLETDDLLEMQGRIKSDFEKQARLLEERQRSALADARSQAALCEGVDLDSPSDEAKLQAALEEAIAAKQDIETRRAAAAKVNQAAGNARIRLSELGEGATVAEAEERSRRATEAVQAQDRKMVEARTLVQELMLKLDAARKALEAEERVQEGLRQSAKAAIDAVEQAKREGSLRTQLQDAIAAGGAEGPSDEELKAAAEAVTTARSAISAGMRVRNAMAAKTLADQHTEQAKALGIQAQRMRDAASDTTTVLTDAIAKINDCPLRVAYSDDGDPRLVMGTRRSDREFFEDRSDAEKWSVVLQIAAAKNRLITLPQSALGELSPTTMEYVHKLAQQHGCYVLSAEADRGELRGEIFNAGKVAAE